MRQFKGGAEIRITKGDLMALLTSYIQDELFKFTMEDHEVTSLSVHPENKYILRMEFKPVKRDRENEA